MNQTEATNEIALVLASPDIHFNDVSVVRAVADPSCPQSDVILVELPNAVLSVTVEILDTP
jgi:hypothetical protein